MEMLDEDRDELLTTSDQLTCAQINQLKEAWQKANSELMKYKELAHNLQRKVETLTSSVNHAYGQLELEATRSQLSQLCCSCPSKPVILVKEVSKVLPKMKYHSLTATIVVKTGESWIAMSSSSVAQETISFRSRTFDEMLKYRARSKASKVTMESLSSILPLPVVNYVHSGTVPATESAFDLFNDESKGRGRRRHNSSSLSPAELLYQEAIVLRMTQENDEDDEIAERCVWIISVRPEHSHAMHDIYSDELSIRQLAVEHFGAHPMVLNGSNEYFGDHSAEPNSAALDFFFPVVEHAAQLVMTALLNQLQSRKAASQVLQGAAAADFSALLSSSSASVGLMLEEAGVVSVEESNLMETLSQRSDEDDVLQANNVVDDAYYEKIWQSVPGVLEEFLTSHVDCLRPPREDEEGEEEEVESQVVRTVRCEMFVTSASLVNEVTEYATTGVAIEGPEGSAFLAEIPLLNCKRVVSRLPLKDADSVEGHEDALNTVLRSALLRDTAAVQSYSEVSFHEKIATNSGRAKGGMAAMERGPQVEFHTLIAVPLLLPEQQEAVYAQMTAAEACEMGGVKGCMLVHVTSFLVETHTPQLGRMGNRPNFAPSSAHVSHAAYMEQIAGSYNLLEAGRQQLVFGVVDIVEAVGGMVLNFLYAHNCRPISLFPTTGTAKAKDQGSMSGPSSTSYADATRYNNSITDGLFSLLMPAVAPEAADHLLKAPTPLNPLPLHPPQPTPYAGMMYHLCTLLHTDWALVITADHETETVIPGTPSDTQGTISAERTTRFTTVETGEPSIRLVDNRGAVRVMAAQELPAACRVLVMQSLGAGTGGGLKGALHGHGTQGHGQGHGHGAHHTPHHLQGHHVYTHELLREIVGLRRFDVSELAPLLHLDHKRALHTLCDSGAASRMHHTIGFYLDAHNFNDYRLKSKGGSLGGSLSEVNPGASNIVLLTGRFLRGPLYAPLPHSPSVIQVRALFQTAIARRDLILTQQIVANLATEKGQNQQEVTFTKALEENLAQLHRNTLGMPGSNVAALVSFRKGLLKVAIEFFSQLHKLHFANYGTKMGDGTLGGSLEVIGIELVVDESTGLEEGRHRKWALSSQTADWVRVPETLEGVKMRGRKVQAPPMFQVGGVVEVQVVTAEVMVDVLAGVYEERGGAVLHVHKRHRAHKKRRYESDSESDTEDDLIGMNASVYIHYEYPVKSKDEPTPSIPTHAVGFSANPTPISVGFFNKMQSAPMWKRILQTFIATHSQALFQPLYPIYTPMKLRRYETLDEEQQWEDDALHTQASNIAINALSSTIVHESTRLLADTDTGGEKNQHPHFRYLYQRKLLRQLTLVPPFSAFMLMPIREVTSTEVALFDDDSTSTGSASDPEIEDVRYVHLLPPVKTTPHGHHHHHHKENQLATCVLPLRLCEAVRDAVRSARTDHARIEEAHLKATEPKKKGEKEAPAGVGVGMGQGVNRVRTSRLIVLEGGMGGVLHNYLSDMHDKQQKRRHGVHHGGGHGGGLEGGHEFDLYGYVDVGTNLDKATKGAHEMALVDPHSLILLYSPLQPSQHAQGGEESDEEAGVLDGVSNAALDHYYIIACRQDRMIVPSSMARLQACLDELFLPSRVLAASQPWFECMSGIEELVKAATKGLNSDFKGEEEPQEAPTPNVEGQCQRILMQTITIIKRIIGDRCLGAVGYQLRFQGEIPKDKEVELVRCCSDVGTVSSKSGKVMTMLQGPSRLLAPATGQQVFDRFAHGELLERHNQAQFQARHLPQGEEYASPATKTSIHYVEMNSLEHIKMLQHSATTRSKTNVGAVQEVLSAAHLFLQSDVRVLQVLITASPSGGGVGEEMVVGSVLVYLSMNSQDTEGEERFPPLSYISREDVLHPDTKNKMVPITPEAVRHCSSLTRGILSCIMRVGDTTGALVSSLYRQQFDSSMQVSDTRGYRAQMQVHSQGLACSLLQIHQELGSMLKDAPHLGDSEPIVSVGGQGNDPNIMQRLLNDPNLQHTVGQQAMGTVALVIEKFLGVTHLYTQEQENGLEIRSNYKSSREECRAKARAFRAYHEAVLSSLSILPPNHKELDDDSVQSGDDKVAENDAVVPDMVALHSAIATAVSTTQLLRKALEVLSELAAYDEMSPYLNLLLSTLAACADEEEEEGSMDTDTSNEFATTLKALKQTPHMQLKEHALEETTPDIFATVWWVLEPGSHISAMNLSNAVRTSDNCLDVNTLHSQAKFLEALISKETVVVQGEELLQALPHLLAFYSAQGFTGEGSFPTVRLLYQPILASLPVVEEMGDDFSDDGNSFVSVSGEKVVVAVVQYLLVGGDIANPGIQAAAPQGSSAGGEGGGGSSMGQSSNGGGGGGGDDSSGDLNVELGDAMRRVGRDRVEQALTYMGQHVALQSRTLEHAGLGIMAKGRISGPAEFTYRLDTEHNMTGGVHWRALAEALQYIVDPVRPPEVVVEKGSAPSANSSRSSGSRSVGGKSGNQSVNKGNKSVSKGNKSVASGKSGKSGKSGRSERSSRHAQMQLDKIAAAAVYSPVSKWVGKLLASLLRAEACMLHVTPSMKQPSAKLNDETEADARYTGVVYEGILFSYAAGVVSSGAPEAPPHVLHVRPSSYQPLYTLVEKYEAFAMKSSNMEIFVLYSASVLSYKPRVSSKYGSNSSSNASGTSEVERAEGAPSKYILACGISSAGTHQDPVRKTTGSGGAALANSKWKVVHFEGAGAASRNERVLRDHDDLLVVEMTRRPSAADIKAFAGVAELVQTYVHAQQQREAISLANAEVTAISTALVGSSQRLMQESSDNELHRRYADLLEELHATTHGGAADLSGSSLGSINLAPESSEFSPLLQDVLHSVSSAQDSICEVLGGATKAVMISASRTVCGEIADLLRTDAMSVASRAPEDPFDHRFEAATKSLSRRALQRMLTVDYPGVGAGGSVNTVAYASAAAAKYEAATLRMAALAVYQGVPLIVDVGDIVEVEEGGERGDKQRVPALARSIIIPVVEHAALHHEDPHPAGGAGGGGGGIMVGGTVGVGAGAGGGSVGGEGADEFGSPVLRLPWVEATLRGAVEAVLLPSKPPGQYEQGGYGGRYDQTRRGVGMGQSMGGLGMGGGIGGTGGGLGGMGERSTKCNPSHAWALQLVFESIEARDEYVNKMLDSKEPSSPHSPHGHSSSHSQRKTSHGGGHGVQQDRPSLYFGFLTGVTRYLSTSMVLCRHRAERDLALQQSLLEGFVCGRSAQCLEQVLLLAAPDEGGVGGGGGGIGGIGGSGSGVGGGVGADFRPLDLTVEQVAATLSHVFQKTPMALPTRGGEDSDEEAAPARFANTFEAAWVNARLHWVNLGVGTGKGGVGGMGGGMGMGMGVGGASSSSSPVGVWLTASLPEERPKEEGDSGAEDFGESKSSGPVAGTAAVRKAQRQEKAQQAQQKAKAKVEDEEDERVVVKPTYALVRDAAVYRRCKQKQWSVGRSALTPGQVQALRETAEGFSLLPVPVPVTTPHSHGQAGAGQGAGHKAKVPIVEESAGVGRYLRPDGTVEFQLLVYVAGAEQPAILEMLLRAQLTPSEGVHGMTGAPLGLAPAVGAQGGKRGKKKLRPVPDELALAEMVEGVVVGLLSPCLPTVRMLRSSVAHLLQHCVAAAGLRQWEAEWEVYLQAAQARISLLSSVVTLLTSEGNRAAGLLQQVQEVLCRLPIRASTLLVRDTATSSTVYNCTIDYASNQTTHASNASTGGGGGMGGAGGGMGGMGGGAAFQSPSNLSAITPHSPQSPHSHRVTYLDLSQKDRHRREGLDKSAPLSTPAPAGSGAGTGAAGLSFSLTQEVQGGSRFGHASLKDQWGEAGGELDGLEQLEIVFECYEVQGSLTVYFTAEESALMRAAGEGGGDFFMGSGGMGGSGSPEPTSRGKSAPTSPYHAVRSPAAQRRDKERGDRGGGNGEGRIETTLRWDDMAEAPTTCTASNEDELVSMHSLLETITRALARRVFELHRGAKNKKAMASKQQELAQRNTLLQQQSDKVEILQNSNSMSKQELESAAAESERLRLLMYAEQRNLKEQLRQKKEMNAHLRQSLLELRQEADTRSLLAKKQNVDLRERLRGLELNQEREAKELDKVRKKEVVAENSTNTLTHQLAEMQRLQRGSDASVRQLRVDLATAHRELAAAQAKDSVRTEGEDGKTKSFLGKIKNLDEELTSARGTNAFLKRQLDTCSLSLKVAQDEHAKQLQQLQTRLTTRTGVGARAGGGYRSPDRGFTSPGAGGAGAGVMGGGMGGGSPDLYDEMAQALHLEQEHTALLRRQLHGLENSPPKKP